MTTPAQQQQKQPPPSGVTRQVTATQAAAAAGTIALAAELAILQALAGMIAAVLAGTMLWATAGRRLRSMVWTVTSEAERELRAVISGATAAVRADVLAVMAADLGPMARLLPALPGTGVPRLTPALHNAFLAALADADESFAAIQRALRAVPEPERRAVAQELLAQVAARGLTGLTDTSGRRWDLAAYVRAATSGAVADLHARLQLAACEAAGIDLVLVTRSDPAPPCPRCAPWVNRVLSVTGRTAGLARITDAGGTFRTATVAGTVAEARAAGLLHNSCKDSLIPWADGAVIPASIPHGTRAPPRRPSHGNDAERARREHAAALTRSARQAAARRARLALRLLP